MKGLLKTRLLVVLFLLFLVSVSCQRWEHSLQKTRETATEESDSRFTEISSCRIASLQGGDRLQCTIIKDEDTEVLYLATRRGYSGGVCVLVDGTGKPLTALPPGRKKVEITE